MAAAPSPRNKSGTFAAMSPDSSPADSSSVTQAVSPAQPGGGASPRLTPPRVAVVPAAGFGTRLRPLTDQIPKELLPVGRLTALERIVRELEAAGVERVVIVVSPTKEALLRQAFAQTRLGVEIVFAIQPQMRGLGDAVLRAAPYVDSTAPFVVALGDAVFEEAAPGAVVSRLIRATKADGSNAVGLAVQEVPAERVSRYGVVRPTTSKPAASAFTFDAIVEKPAPEDAPSRYAAAARYVLPLSVFAALADTPPDAKGEVQLTPALQTLLWQGCRGVATALGPGEVRHDLGNFDSYFRAFCAFALSDPEFGDRLEASLASTLAGAPTTAQAGRP